MMLAAREAKVRGRRRRSPGYWKHDLEFLNTCETKDLVDRRLVARNGLYWLLGLLVILAGSIFAMIFYDLLSSNVLSGSSQLSVSYWSAPASFWRGCTEPRTRCSWGR